MATTEEGRLPSAAPRPEATPRRGWAKRIGLAGVFFFAIKGLAWLTVPAWLVGRGCAP